MTKRLIALFMCTVMLALTGCSAKAPTDGTVADNTVNESTSAESIAPESTTAESSADAEETIEDMMTSVDLVRNTTIKAVLPKENKLGENARDLIMGELKSKIFRIWDRNSRDLTVELETKSICERDGFVSMVFTGTGAVTGEDAKSLSFSVTIDEKNTYVAALADIYKIDDELVYAVQSKAGSYEDLTDTLVYADTFMSSATSYLTEDSVVILLDENAEAIELSAEDMKARLITDADTAAVLDTLRANAEGDNNAKWLSAFFSGDFNTCASLIDAEPSALAMLCTVKFGSIRMREITVTDSYGYSYPRDEITFTIEESSFENLPVGKYTYRMTKASDSLFDVGSWERVAEGVSMPEDAMGLIGSMIFYAVPHNVNGYTLSDEEKELFEHGVSDLIFSLDYRIGDGDGEMTADEFKEAAKTLFGLDSWEPNEKFAYEEDGMWAQTGHGGVHYYYDVTRVTDRDDKIEVYVQVYGDYMSLSRSYTVKFTMAKTDSVYGYRFDKIEYTDMGNCDPYRFMI